MALRIPPISCLRALEAVTRYRSFTRAAAELDVTQSAISHQIKLIEELWGLKLFERKGRGISPTDAGKELAEVTREFFDRITQVLDAQRVVSSHERLRVDTLQSFAVKWLVPRLGRFNDLNPNVDVWISTHDRLVDFSAEKVDIAIRLGNGHFPGLYSVLLLQEDVFPVCTPEFKARMGMPASPQEMLGYPLLLRLGEPSHTSWEDWFEAAGLPGVKLTEGSRFPDTNMALEAALEGLGIALARTAHVQEELASGRLIRIFDIPCPSNVAYYIVCPQGHQERPTIAKFVEWIFGEVEAPDSSTLPRRVRA